MSTLTYLDGYCERAGASGLWAEPLNLISNAAFLIAAGFALKLFLKLERKPADVLLLIILLFSIGIGSGWWHAIPTGTSLLGDVIPILLFINVYILSFFHRVLQLGWPKVIGWWLLFQAVNFGSEAILPRDTLNGSIMYVPTWGTLALMTLHLYHIRHTAEKPVAAALGIFTLSLTFRTVDMNICPALSAGTHFLWHCLNSVVLYRLLEVLMGNFMSSPESRSDSRAIP